MISAFFCFIFFNNLLFVSPPIRGVLSNHTPLCQERWGEVVRQTAEGEVERKKNKIEKID